jgi:hypothetical protein
VIDDDESAFDMLDQAPVTRDSLLAHIDSAALVALDTLSLDPEVVADTAGILFKQRDDVAALTADLADRILKAEPFKAQASA